jgi:hypothetical protein
MYWAKSVYLSFPSHTLDSHHISSHQSLEHLDHQTTQNQGEQACLASPVKSQLGYMESANMASKAKTLEKSNLGRVHHTQH